MELLFRRGRVKDADLAIAGEVAAGEAVPVEVVSSEALT
jgi:hypothetical protein